MPIIKLIVPGAILSLLMSTVVIAGGRCTCYHDASKTVGSCAAFANPQCDVVYIPAYKPGCTWEKGDPDYWKNAGEAAKNAPQKAKALGAMISVKGGAPGWGDVKGCIRAGIRNGANFQYAFIDFEYASSCGGSPMLSLGSIIPPANIQVAVGAGTCQASWATANLTYMCYDGAQNKRPCKDCTEKNARYMYIAPTPPTNACSNPDLYYR
jgi:hypothetical protein